MDTTSNASIASDTTASPEGSTTLPKPKGKGKTAKLKLVTRGFRPGQSLVSTPAGGDRYFISFGIPLTGPIGSAEEIAMVHQFGIDLDTVAQQDQVGVVEKFDFAKGTADVTLRLKVPEAFPETPSDEEKDGLVSAAFTKIADFMGEAPALKLGTGGTSATWEFRVNGSVLDNGRF